ncbi:histidine phosphatase family protein [Pseudoroseomonas deserti]|uniref:Histidine phosphatase family protein n=1 Tax=Teichococcus deserti TaxID=1817963 RepID=A0A1V2GV84_9PROT|nr:histidine phosphatase family protein [Pseudoroseomonas deserti]ONG45622.1 histidine phosphatase family protein [Pseudoroseomonas deserti]
MQQRWPERLWIVRHGESAGNVARDAAQAAEAARIDISLRDVDVPLSDRGVEQATALGHWFAQMPAAERPDVLLVSPYLRARQTAEHISQAAAFGAELTGPRVDERLREKEFGLLDRLTRIGIEQEFPEQAALRRHVGKFYHRPPSGESWCDVILRLRSALDTISLHYGGRRVLLVGHQVVVLCLRYLLEELDEERILEIDRQADVANCGVTEYRFDPSQGPSGGLALHRYNFTAPLAREGAAVTAEPDAQAAAR